ncbi:MAG: ABC transporter permease [Lachnospiraceae bacterium]|nr:ABC transporter permease [Lachnospiraceae bacterium]
METENNGLKYKGHFGQLLIYLGKQFRMFVLQSDWKVLPMAAIIAGMVSMAVGKGLYVSMEGTFQANFALTCVCIWNGFFNSIQSICRERPIIKREHRAGMHITSYVASHLVYQLFLCAMQSAITMIVLGMTGIKYPAEGAIFSFIPDMFITLLLITYTSDMMALMISAIVKTPMAAMTVMPFMLILQLVFAGFIQLPEKLADVTKLMVSKWGVRGLCVISDYNNLPAVVVWNKMVSSGDKIELGGGVSLKDVMSTIEENGMRDVILKKLGEANARMDFERTFNNLWACWEAMLVFSLTYAIITVIFLEFIDKDTR